MKGFHTQGLVVLFRDAPELDVLLAALAPFRPEPRAATDASWMGDAPGLVFRAGGGATAVVHSFARAWPDGMGDPKEDPRLFAAWSLGFFGPFTYPRGLERATQQAWHWREAKATVAEHRGFVRVLTTFAAGAAPDAPVVPAGYDARVEIESLMPVVTAIGSLPGALAIFDPGGEVVLAPAHLAARMKDAVDGKRPPIDVWSNVRMFRLTDVAPWMVMDTVGLGQLDRGDLEACFPSDRVEPGQVAGFLRNLTLYLLERGDVVKDGDTVDGPGGSWRARVAHEALLEPPRATLRFFPVRAGAPPASLQRGLGPRSPKEGPVVARPVVERSPAPEPSPPAKNLWKRLFGD